MRYEEGPPNLDARSLTVLVVVALVAVFSAVSLLIKSGTWWVGLIALFMAVLLIAVGICQKAVKPTDDKKPEDPSP